MPVAVGVGVGVCGVYVVCIWYVYVCLWCVWGDVCAWIVYLHILC